MACTARPFILGSAAAVLVATATLRPVTVLELENTARGEAVRLALHDARAFSVTSHHSMYEQPVTEEFVVDADHRIVLKAVSSPSAAVREYFGLTAAGERHEVQRAMREVVFRVAAGTPQRLHLGRVEHSFLEFGEHGERLVLRAVRRPAAVPWLSALRADMMPARRRPPP
jgi:hypothetical protein